MKFRALFDDYCRVEDRSERIQFACRYPALISSKLLLVLKGELDREQSTEAARCLERLMELGELCRFIAESANRYPAGVGPVEREAKRVVDGETSLAAAIAEVCKPEFAMQLAVLYVHVLTWHAEKLAMQGDARTAVLWARLLAEACLAASPTGSVSEQLEIAGIGWIQIAGVALGSMPDGEILNSAATLGQELLERLGKTGDRKQQAGLLHAMGALYSDPISSSSGSGIQRGEQQWLQRLEVEKGLALAQHHLQQYPLPSVEEALDKALEYFQRALPDREGVGRGITLKAMAQTLVYLASSKKEPLDKDRVGELCLEALQLLPEGDYNHRAVLSILNSIGLSMKSETFVSRSMDSADEVLQQAVAMAPVNPSQALALLDKAENLFKARSAEAQRRARLDLMVQLFPAAFNGPLGDRFNGSAAVVSQQIVDTAQEEKWDVDQLGAALICLARRTGQTNEEELGLNLVQLATQQSPTIAAYQAPIAYLSLELLVGAAVNALNSGDPIMAVQRYAQALAPSVRLQLQTQTFDLLERIADLAKTPVEAMAITVLTGLAPVAAEIDRELGAAGTEALQVLYQNTFAGFGESINSASIGMLLQLAKGAHFSAMLREGLSFDWRKDETATRLVRELEAVQRQIGEHGQFKPLDEVLLVSSVSLLQATAGKSPRERLENLELAFDRHVNKNMTVAAMRSAILQPEVIQQWLGSRSVLLDYFFARYGEDQRAMYIMVYTAENMICFRNPLRGDSKDLVVDTKNSEAVLDSIGLRTYRLRSALQLDPGNDLLHPDAKAALNDDFELLLGTPTWNYLETLRTSGKDHLCIRAHGALRYYPMHLLGRGGKDLAQHWVVTSIPSLECLMPRQSLSRSIYGQALGLTYAGGEPFKLPELESARGEVESIAKVFKSKAFLDAEVTEKRVLDALQTATQVHICAHGAHNPGSPLLQHFFVTPDNESDGRICAYEILGHDLHGLEILSLGTCDSALGRFDAGDNLSGLPAAFFIAGTSSIVASLWEMLDDAAAMFFLLFYDALASGSQRLDAFRQAQEKVRNAYPQARDWAGFCFLGAWDQRDLAGGDAQDPYLHC